ncbi:maleylpyruvate isomerase N-terminal domain-containing protein [Longispora sp. NPDC051575]|uniref:maleylpyruvate isomerase N-terminal domain-containing protein n=1 Tax=Longispora sp. NPDC051575 TaxID=3154943 RepID=UPI0034138E31
MTGIRDDFLATARTAARLLRDPAVAARWDGPSALAEFSVGGLAGHLAYQVLAVPTILAGPVPHEPTIPVLEHYGQVAWVGTAPDEDINVRIRAGGDQEAADGPDALAARVDAALAELDAGLVEEPDRAVRIPFWGPWSLTLDDLLVTRMMELAVHSDDLAVSVGVPTPELPAGAVDTVVDLLSRLAVRRHGPTAVLRALSRAERAPTTITAF